MLNLIKNIKKIKNKIYKLKNKKSLEQFRIKYLSKNGYLKNIMKMFKNLPNNIKPKIGKIINKFKKKILILFNKQNKIIKLNFEKNNNYIDISLPGRINLLYGNKHPITLTLNKITNIFNKLGFNNISSSEIVNKKYNFSLLNINKYHPSINKNDTFWINKNLLLRTQTSCIQIKYMKYNKPPFKIISSGCVFRKDYDKTHTPMFHQTEIFIVDKNINFSNLLYIIKNFLNLFFNKNIKFKIIPSYFPFTEPSLEIFIKTKKNKWIEILGCGLIHPKIFKNINIDYNKYSGLALGLGIERLTMIKYNISNINKLYLNNIKFLDQF